MLVLLILLHQLTLYATVLWAEDESGVDYFAPENVLRYAHHLYDNDDYLRAAGEYERYLFLADISDNELLLHRIGICYRLSNKYDRAVKYFQSAVDNGRNPAIEQDSIFQIGYSYYLDNRLSQSRSYLNKHIQQVESQEIRTKIYQLITTTHLLERRWESAKYSSLLVEKPDPLTIALSDFAEEGVNLPRKSKLLAGVFSGIVPGAGKVYSGYWRESIYPLIVIGFTTWRAYSNYKNDGAGSFGFLFYTSLGASFYLGNIYGSAVSAHNYNRKQEENLVDKIKIAINGSY